MCCDDHGTLRRGGPLGECSRVGREESLSERRYVPVADMFSLVANHYVVMN